MAHPRTADRRRQALGLLAAATLGWTAASANAADWLDLRRKGPAAIVAAARAADASEPWLAVYEARLPEGHALHGLRLTLARAPGPKGGMLVRVDGPATLRGVGAVASSGKTWLRLPGGKVQPVANDALFQTIAPLGVPLAVFAATEVLDRFELQNEGEFDDVGILRLRPRYEAGPHLQPMKLGVSKRFLATVVLEVTDLQGKPLAGALWLGTREDKGLIVHDKLRLRPVEGDARALELERVEVRRGAAARVAFQPSALK